MGALFGASRLWVYSRVHGLGHVRSTELPIEN
jgi:hypothetical protein